MRRESRALRAVVGPDAELLRLQLPPPGGQTVSECCATMGARKAQTEKWTVQFADMDGRGVEGDNGCARNAERKTQWGETRGRGLEVERLVRWMAALTPAWMRTTLWLAALIGGGKPCSWPKSAAWWQEKRARLRDRWRLERYVLDGASSEREGCVCVWSCWR